MYVSHLESALDGTHYEADRLQTTHRGRPLWVRYDLWIKDEAQMPTGTFKSRGLSAAVTMAQHLGVERVAIPTAGNRFADRAKDPETAASGLCRSGGHAGRGGMDRPRRPRGALQLRRRPEIPADARPRSPRLSRDESVDWDQLAS